MSLTVSSSHIRPWHDLLCEVDSFGWLIGRLLRDSTHTQTRLVHMVLHSNSNTTTKDMVNELNSNLPLDFHVIGAIARPSSIGKAKIALEANKSEMKESYYLLTTESTTQVHATRLDGSSVDVSLLSDGDLLASGGEWVGVRVSHEVDIWTSEKEDLTERLKLVEKDLQTTNTERFGYQLASEKNIIQASMKEMLLTAKSEDAILDQSVSSLLADENPLVQRKKAQTKLSSSSSSSSSAMNSISPLPLQDYCIELNLLRRSSSSSSDLPPTALLQYTQCKTPVQAQVRLSIVYYAQSTQTLKQVLSVIQNGLAQQVASFIQKIETEGLPPSSSSITLQSLHFQPASFPHALTALWLSPSSTVATRFDGNTSGKFPKVSDDPDADVTHPSLTLSKAEEYLTPQRARLHRVWNLPTDRPAFRWVNAIYFPSAPSNEDPNQYIIQPRLFNVHEALGRTSTTGGEISLVDGRYAYYHYLQDRQSDSGWGCAYRTLQSICSWFILGGYTRDRPVPTIRDIQEILVTVGDKSSKFVGSREWIGSTEVGLVLDHAYGIVTKTLFVSSGAEVPSHARQLRQHFQQVGTPVMIGGGVLAYGLLGIDYNEATGECKFLILDPHYEGVDNLSTILKGGWVGWKKADLFLPDAFYNFALPQRPMNCI